MKNRKRDISIVSAFQYRNYTKPQDWNHQEIVQYVDTENHTATSWTQKADSNILHAVPNFGEALNGELKIDLIGGTTRLRICSPYIHLRSGNCFWLYRPLEINKLATIKIQRRPGLHWHDFIIEASGSQRFVTTLRSYGTRESDNVNVYTSDPWMPSANVVMEE